MKEAIDLVKDASKLQYDADFTNGRCFVDVKSILGVLSSDFSRPCEVIIISDKVDENINEFINSIKGKIMSLEVK